MVKTKKAKPLNHAPCVFELEGVILLAHVDDILVIGANFESVKTVKNNIGQNLPFIDCGKANHLLGVDISKEDEHYVIKQSKGMQKVNS